MGIVDRIKGLFGGSAPDVDAAAETEEDERKVEEELNYEHLQADRERERRDMYDRLSDVDGRR